MSQNNTHMGIPAKQNKGYAWLVLGMMLLLYFMNYADRSIATGLLEKIKAHYEVSDTYMGFVIGPAFAFIYCAAAIPIARLADRNNRVRIIAMGAIVWSLFTMLSGLAKTPEMFAAARFGIGIGEAAFFAPAYSLLSDYFPPKKRALAFAIMNLGVYFGGAFGMIGGAQIAQAYDWQTAFLFLGAPGIILALLTLIFVREPERGRLDHEAGIEKPKPLDFKTTMARLWSRPAYRNLVWSAALGGFASIAFGSWAVAMFERIFDIANTEANTRYGGTAMLAGIIGVLAMGWLCDRGSKNNIQTPYRLSAAGLFAFAVISIGLCFSPQVGLATLLVIPASLLGAGWVVAVQAALQDLLPAEMRATATAIWAFALTFAGLVIGVMTVGTLNDFLAAQYGNNAIRYSMALTLIVAIPASLLIFRAGKTADADRIALRAMD